MEENVKPISQLLQTVGHQLINAAVNKNFNTFRSGIRHLDELLRNFYSGTLVTIGGMCGMGKPLLRSIWLMNLPSCSNILCSSFL